MRFMLMFSALITLAGCATDEEPSGPMDGGSDAHVELDARPSDANVLDAFTEAGSGDASPKNDAGVPPPSILARTSLDTHTCSVQRELRNYKPLTWGYTGHALASIGNATWLARVEAQTQNSPFDPGPARLLVSKLMVDSTLGEPVVVPVADAKLVEQLALVPLAGSSFALFWYEAQAQEGMPAATTKLLRMAVFDAAGAITAAPKLVHTETADRIAGLQAARGSDGGMAVLWSQLSFTGGTKSQLVVVDATGNVRAAPRTLGMGASNDQLLAADGGYALLTAVYASGTTRGEVRFALLDGSGMPRGAARTLADSSTLGPRRIGFRGSALTATAGGYVAAWSEGEAGNMNFAQPGGAYQVLRVARLDAAGAMVTSAFVREPTDSIDEEVPVLTPFGAAVALLWGRAKHIYVCAGCVPDHSLELVLLDPDTLTPRSNVVKVTAPQGGLLGTEAAVQGETLLTALGIAFHVHSEPGFAAFRCTSK